MTKNSELRNKKLAVAVGAVTAFVSTFAGAALNLAIPDMSQYFHMGAASVGWIVTVYLLVIAAISVPCGKLADNTNRRTVLLTGLIVFACSSICSIFAPSTAFLLIMRGLQGLGSSLIFATNMPLAMAAFPPQERGRAIGLVTAGTYFGLAVGPFLGGFLNNTFGWKSIFIFGVCICAIAFVLALIGIPKTENVHNDTKQDVAGNLIFMVMLASFIYGLTALNSLKFGWAFMVFGLLMGILFVKVELKAENPVIDVRIFKESRTFTLSNLTALFNYSATFAIGYMTSIYLQVVQGYSSGTAGLILVTQPFFMAILSPRMGKLSDKIQPYKLASQGMALCAISLGSFMFFTVDTPVWLIVVVLAVAGIGIGIFSSPNTNVIMGCVPPQKFGVGNAILGTMRTTGQSSGLAIITLVVSGTVGDISLYEANPQQLVTTIHIGFAIFTVLCAAGIFMSMQRREKSKNRERE